MATEEEHQIIKDVRELRSYPEDVPQEEIFKREAIRMATWSPEQRAITS